MPMSTRRPDPPADWCCALCADLPRRVEALELVVLGQRADAEQEAP